MIKIIKKKFMTKASLLFFSSKYVISIQLDSVIVICMLYAILKKKLNYEEILVINENFNQIVNLI